MAISSSVGANVGVLARKSIHHPTQAHRAVIRRCSHVIRSRRNLVFARRDAISEAHDSRTDSTAPGFGSHSGKARMGTDPAAMAASEPRARVVDDTPPDSVVAFVRPTAGGFYRGFTIHRAGGYLFNASIPRAMQESWCARGSAMLGVEDSSMSGSRRLPASRPFTSRSLWIPAAGVSGLHGIAGDPRSATARGWTAWSGCSSRSGERMPAPPRRTATGSR